MSSARHPLLALPATVAAAVLNALDPPMRALQRLLGVPRIGWMFVTPNLAILGLFTFLPIVVNFYFAFTGGVQLYPSERPFTGLDNLGTLFDCGNYLDPASCRKDLFWRSIYNTAEFALLQVGLMVAFALIWKWVLQREGVLNAVLASASASPVGWLSDASWAFFWCVFVSIWAHMGFYTLILLAGLQAIPADLYEAAEMDGASPWRRFSRLTLPLLMPNLIVVLVLGLIRAVQVFDEVFVLTGGGPGSATTFIVQFIYQTAFAEAIHQYGLAAAASLVLAASLLILTLVQLKLTRRNLAGRTGRDDA